MPLGFVVLQFCNGHIVSLAILSIGAARIQIIAQWQPGDTPPLRFPQTYNECPRFPREATISCPDKRTRWCLALARVATRKQIVESRSAAIHNHDLPWALSVQWCNTSKMDTCLCGANLAEQGFAKPRKVLLSRCDKLVRGARREFHDGFHRIPLRR